MSVSRSRYDEKVLSIEKDGKTYNTLVAKMATDYFNEDTIKAKFHLDYVHKVQDGKFIGGIYETASTKLKYHDTMNRTPDDDSDPKGDASKNQRLSHLRVRHNGLNYALFNDAGLHTKPDVAFYHPASLTGALTAYAWAGYGLVVYVNWESAYLLSSYECNVYASINGGGNIIITTFEGMAKNTFRREAYRLFRNLSQGDTIKITANHDNQEGVIEVTQTITVREAISQGMLSNYYGNDTQPSENVEKNYLLYMFASADLGNVTTTASNTGIYLYTTDEMTLRNTLTSASNKAPQGWYNIGDPDYYFYVDANGQVTHKYKKPTPVVNFASVLPIIKANGEIEYRIANPDGLRLHFILEGVYFYETANSVSHIHYVSLNGDKEVKTSETSMTVTTSSFANNIPQNASYCMASITNELTVPVYTPMTMLLKDIGDREI